VGASPKGAHVGRIERKIRLYLAQFRKGEG
jgi:hypothetical protein